MIKGIFPPEKLLELRLQWYETVAWKSENLRKHRTERASVFNRRKGKAESDFVLQCSPIVTATLEPPYDGIIILNGKHRSIEAAVRGVGLRYYLIEHFSDIEHALPAELYAGFQHPIHPYQTDTDLSTPRAVIEALYNRRNDYHRDCLAAGVVTVADVVQKLSTNEAK